MRRLWYLADKVAQEIRRRSMSPQDGPIDVVALAAALGVEAREADIEEDGQLLPSNGRGLILYRSGDPWARQRFTIAHELIHLAVRDPAIGGRAAAPAVGAGGFHSIERLCDCGAAALLMPHRWMLRSFTEATSKDEQSLRLVLEVAQAATVSPAAAFLRLQGLFAWPHVLLAWVSGARGWTVSSEVGAFTSAQEVPRFAASVAEFLSRVYAKGTGRCGPRNVTSDVFWDFLPVEQWDREQYLPAEVVVARGRVPNVITMVDPSTEPISAATHIEETWLF